MIPIVWLRINGMCQSARPAFQCPGAAITASSCFIATAASRAATVASASPMHHSNVRLRTAPGYKPPACVSSSAACQTRPIPPRPELMFKRTYARFIARLHKLEANTSRKQKPITKKLSYRVYARSRPILTASRHRLILRLAAIRYVGPRWGTALSSSHAVTADKQARCRVHRAVYACGALVAASLRQRPFLGECPACSTIHKPLFMQSKTYNALLSPDYAELKSRQATRITTARTSTIFEAQQYVSCPTGSRCEFVKKNPARAPLKRDQPEQD